ncbi:MAG: hypothetical protein G01um101420_467 [Parcubacteria group bacterium Gr01-1014_20]|nr:MAG: hypothetical protein G01um101420_467 [Parcubacteria group bacterium Gr01-1014_20]
MKRFVLKCIVFFVINLAFVLLLYITNNNFNIYNHAITESNFLTIPQNANYDFIILGTSHARQLSVGERQRLIEEGVGMNFMNIAGSGLGILPEKIYLSYFFQRQNSVKDVVYVIDPFVFYSPQWNEEITFDNEPFRITLLSALVENRFSTNTIMGYVGNFLRWPPFAGFDPIWDNTSTSTLEKEVGLSNLKEAIDREHSALYPDGFETSNFNKYTAHLKSIIDMSKSHGARVIFIIPPTLWDFDPGKQTTKNLLINYQKSDGVGFYDLSGSLKNPKFYSDSSHFNTKGAVYFSTYFLKQILTETRATKP